MPTVSILGSSSAPLRSSEKKCAAGVVRSGDRVLPRGKKGRRRTEDSEKLEKSRQESDRNNGDEQWGQTSIRIFPDFPQFGFPQFGFQFGRFPSQFGPWNISKFSARCLISEEIVEFIWR